MSYTLLLNRFICLNLDAFAQKIKVSKTLDLSSLSEKFMQGAIAIPTLRRKMGLQGYFHYFSSRD